MKTLRILHISDLHSNLNPLHRVIKNDESFDWVVLTGDIAPTHVKYMDVLDNGFRKIDREAEAAHQLQWATNTLKPLIDKIPHSHSIFVSGNHDFFNAEGLFEFTQFKGAKTIEIDGIKVGLAVGINPLIGEWHEEISEFEFNEHLLSLDPTIQVLITHAPPSQVLDSNYCGQHIGYNCLYNQIFGSMLGNQYPHFTRLRLHMFGHAHEARGIKEIEIEANEIYAARKIMFSNASLGYHAITQKL
jgi:Icc-related predicted phosphoesterase